MLCRPTSFPVGHFAAFSAGSGFAARAGAVCQKWCIIEKEYSATHVAYQPMAITGHFGGWMPPRLVAGPATVAEYTPLGADLHN